MAQSLFVVSEVVFHEKIVMGLSLSHDAAVVGVAVKRVVFHQTPAGALKDDAVLEVVEKGTVLNGDVRGMIRFIGGIHAAVNGLVKGAELNIFNMDVTAVDPDPDTPHRRGNVGQVKRNRVDQQKLFRLIV